jgi:hypothetical protein
MGEVDPTIKIGLDFDLRSAFAQPAVVFDRSLEAVPELLYFDSPYCHADEVNAIDSLSDQSSVLALLRGKCSSTPTSLTSAECLGTIGNLLSCMCSCHIGYDKLTSASIEGLRSVEVVLQMLPNFKQFNLQVPPHCPQPCVKPSAPPLPGPSVVAQSAPCSDSDVAALTKLSESADDDQQLIGSLTPTCRGCVYSAVRYRLPSSDRKAECLKLPDQASTRVAPILTLTGAPTSVVQFDWTSGFNGAAHRTLTMNAGDLLTFTQLAGHNIVQVNSMQAFDSCDFKSGVVKSPGTDSVYDSSTAASYLYRTPTVPGTTEYFVCGVGSHCAMGQKLALTVTATRAPTEPVRAVPIGPAGRMKAPTAGRCAMVVLGGFVLSSLLVSGWSS